MNGRAITIGQVHVAARALQYLDLPAIDPYQDFGAKRAGGWLSIYHPLYLLAPFLDARLLAWLIKLTAVGCAGFGAFLLVRKFTDNFIALLAGVTCMTTYRTLGNLSCYQYGQDWLLVPLAIFFMHIVLERRSLIGLIGLCVLGMMMNANSVYILPVVTFVYALVMGWFYFHRSFLAGAASAVALTALLLLAGSAHLIPWYFGKVEYVADMEVIGRTLKGHFGAGEGVGRLLDLWAKYNTLECLIGPFERPGFRAYIPPALYLTIAVTLAGALCFFKDRWRMIAPVIALPAACLGVLALLLFYVSALSAKLDFMRLFHVTDSTYPLSFSLSVIGLVSAMAAYVCLRQNTGGRRTPARPCRQGRRRRC